MEKDIKVKVKEIVENKNKKKKEKKREISKENKYIFQILLIFKNK